jgi:CRP-like cAMP-binding protein
MRTIAELLADIPELSELDAAQRDLIAGCGTNRTYAAGELLLREGQPADTFFVIRRGAVALESSAPQHGPVVVETLHDGDLCGWSWLFGPHRNVFDARAVVTAHVIAFDGTCLRGKCDADPVLGYALMRAFANVVVERLQQTRLRLLDLYGPALAR